MGITETIQPDSKPQNNEHSSGNIERGAQQEFLESLEPGKYQAPRWYVGKRVKNSLKSYEDFLTEQLRARYMDLESEFRLTMYNQARGIGRDDHQDFQGLIGNLLSKARAILEQEVPNSFTASTTLNLIERYMVWMYSAASLHAQVPIVCSNLGFSNVESKGILIEQLKKANSQPINTVAAQSGDEDPALTNLRVILDEAIDRLSQQKLEDQISSRLQIQRLTALLYRGLVIFVVFLAATPLTTNIESLKNWPFLQILGGPGLTSGPAAVIAPGWVTAVATWLSALSVALVGAFGGFISGLIQARSTHITLAEYQENRLKLFLKPLVGALVSLLLYVLLSWQILPITVQNTGSYIVLAFLSGFSERFFFQLLEIKTDKELADDGQDSTKTSATTTY